eukprot:RCo004341
MPSTAVKHFFREHLRRGLTWDEERLLTQLSPQGMAKVNTDLSRGVPASDTLRSLTAAFRLFERFQKRALAALSPEATALRERLARPLTAAELCLLTKWPGRRLSESTAQYLEMEDLFEEMAHDLFVQQVEQESSGLTNILGRPMIVTLLAPTAVDGDCGLTLVAGGKELRVGPSPASVWFESASSCESAVKASAKAGVSPTITAALGWILRMNLLCTVEAPSGGLPISKKPMCRHHGSPPASITVSAPSFPMRSSLKLVSTGPKRTKGSVFFVTI